MLRSLGRRRPTERLVLLAIAALLAYLAGRWSSPDEGRHATSSAPRDYPDSIRGNAIALDGDTLDLAGVRVRLFGVDAFERDQLCSRSDGTRYGCGQDARATLERAVSGALVTCRKRDVDRYGRMVATCTAGGQDLAELLVREGNALAYRRYSDDYVPAERQARSARRGAWEGSFEQPWDYRHEGRAQQERTGG